jgi:hypothetical protein
MKLRWHLFLFLIVFGIESSLVVIGNGNRPPEIGDSAEVHNIAYSLAHGRGYSFDWNDEGWRSLWQDQNTLGEFDFVTVRRGAYPTMFRPPLMPILVAAILKVFPQDSFLAWRIFDSAAFAIAVCLLCDVAFVHGGVAALAPLLILLMGDPLRHAVIPGWWTEGLAFDFLSLLVWLIANGGRLGRGRYRIYAGLGLGLLCLDRAIFILALPWICLTLAAARHQPGGRVPNGGSTIKSASIILALAMLVQMPWWVRNVAVSGQFLPLGTQGGFNLPDEYGEYALHIGTQWTGKGIRDAWIPPSEATRPIPIPPGFSRESFYQLWPFTVNYDPNDHRLAAVIYAAVCTSLPSEIAVSAAGERAAIEWIRANSSELPRLMVEKAITLTSGRRAFLAIGALLLLIAYMRMRQLRRIIACLVSLIACYVWAVALTHVIIGRFLIPILPPLYVGMALGVSAMMRPDGFKVLRGESAETSSQERVDP